MNFNDFCEMIFTTLDFPHVSMFTATSFFGTVLMFNTFFSWRAWRAKQNVQIVKVAEALPEKADLVDYLVKKAREAGDEQVANYLLAFSLAGKVGVEDESQRDGIRFLTDVTRNKDQKMADSLAEAFSIMT